MIMTHTHAKLKENGPADPKDRLETGGWSDGRTDGRAHTTDRITFPANAVTNKLVTEQFVAGYFMPGSWMSNCWTFDLVVSLVLVFQSIIFQSYTFSAPNIRLYRCRVGRRPLERIDRLVHSRTAYQGCCEVWTRWNVANVEAGVTLRFVHSTELTWTGLQQVDPCSYATRQNASIGHARQRHDLFGCSEIRTVTAHRVLDTVVHTYAFSLFMAYSSWA